MLGTSVVSPFCILKKILVNSNTHRLFISANFNTT